MLTGAEPQAAPGLAIMRQMVTRAETEPQAVVRGILESLSDEKIVLGIPGTDYRIQLVPTVPASQIATPIGKRIKGAIHAQALRMFAAQGGGRFIEPIWGEPRIVAGVVLAVDEPNRRVLVDVAAPMWMTLADRQPPGELFPVGQLVNCYLQSGTSFTPLSA